MDGQALATQPIAAASLRVLATELVGPRPAGTTATEIPEAAFAAPDLRAPGDPRVSCVTRP